MPPSVCSGHCLLDWTAATDTHTDRQTDVCTYVLILYRYVHKYVYAQVTDAVAPHQFRTVLLYVHVYTWMNTAHLRASHAPLKILITCTCTNHELICLFIPPHYPSLSPPPFTLTPYPSPLPLPAGTLGFSSSPPLPPHSPYPHYCCPGHTAKWSLSQTE